jgi:hypothetical protein
LPGDADFSWLQLFGVALGGGLTVKLVDIIYQEIRRRQDKTLTASKFVDEHLDPLLKAADEVVGKLHSLATSDFKQFSEMEMSLNPIPNNDFGSLLYLIGRFWARMEIIRQEGLSVAIANDKRGALLQDFFACLESRKVRIVNRISQRAIGEVLLKPAPDYLRNIGYVEFIRALEATEDTRRWINPLADALRRTAGPTGRQQLLLYGAVVHAMIDTLDPRHTVTTSRPSYPIKLSDKTRKNLKYRVFGVYLKFVADKDKYLVWDRARKG